LIPQWWQNPHHPSISPTLAAWRDRSGLYRTRPCLYLLPKKIRA
jgi:hypothetical protein